MRLATRQNVINGIKSHLESANLRFSIYRYNVAGYLLSNIKLKVAVSIILVVRKYRIMVSV